MASAAARVAGESPHPEAVPKAVMRLLLTLLLASAPLSAHAAEPLDPAPRTAVISAFPPELAALEAATGDKHAYTAAGARFVTGTLEGKPVVLFLSGISMNGQNCTPPQS